MNLTPVIKELTKQRTQLEQAITLLHSIGGHRRTTTNNEAGVIVTTGTGHRMSAAARRRISRAQKARWAKMKR